MSGGPQDGRLASRILLGGVTGRTPLPGELAINYLVTARLSNATTS